MMQCRVWTKFFNIGIDSCDIINNILIMRPPFKLREASRARPSFGGARSAGGASRCLAPWPLKFDIFYSVNIFHDYWIILLIMDPNKNSYVMYLEWKDAWYGQNTKYMECK